MKAALPSDRTCFSCISAFLSLKQNKSMSGYDQRRDLRRRIKHLQLWAREEPPARERRLLSNFGSGLNVECSQLPLAEARGL